MIPELECGKLAVGAQAGYQVTVSRLARGYEVDKPRGLSKVTITE